ncbi:hypothetical protein Dimus_006003 [Dionaea muscipula]
MIVIHLKKKDVVKSKVRGVEMELDHEKLATIQVCTGANGICEYIKEVWEESKYTKPLEITRRFANVRVSWLQEGSSRRTEAVSTICSFYGNEECGSREVKIGEEMRKLRLRRKMREEEEERNKDDFDWEAVIDEATIEGESGSDDQFYDAQVEVEEPMMKHQQHQQFQLHLQLSRKIKNLQESTPRVILAEKLNF